MKLRFYTFFFLLAITCSSLMASMASDSILIELKNTPENKERILLLNKLSRTFLKTDIDSSLYYAKQGLDQATEIDYGHGIAENAASMADYYVILDSLDMAKSYYIHASSYFDELGMDFDLANVLMVIGNIYLSQSNYSEALMYYKKSQRICEEKDYYTILPHIYNNTGIIYLNLGEKDKALSSLLKSYNEFKIQDAKIDMANTISNIASIHMQNSQDSLAISYHIEALKIFEENGKFIDAAYTNIELGNYEFNKGNYSKALRYFNESYDQIVNQSITYLGPKSRALVSVLGNLGRVHYQLGDTQKSIDYLKESLLLAQQNDYVNWIESNTHQLSLIYENEGKLEKALYYFKIYEQYGDSILNESSIKKITQLEMQFEFDKEIKERELKDAQKSADQQKKEFIYIFLISLGVFVAILAIMLYINQRNKTSKVELKRKNLKLEHEKLQQDLEHRNKELATNVMYLLSKNEFITSTAEKLTKAKMNFKKENQKIIQDIIRDLLINSSKDVWKEFEVRFQEVHSDFYENLNKRFPDLTPNEKKICAFLRLNMSTKDISAITYQSVRSIDMARFRLRKKIELETDENLVTFLSQI
ncbi:MAG: tetratricopeptide repeat protein [Bacteroidota bacterium]